MGNLILYVGNAIPTKTHAIVHTLMMEDYFLAKKVKTLKVAKIDQMVGDRHDDQSGCCKIHCAVLPALL